MTPPNDPLKPWKDAPPKSADEAATASLLQEVRAMPTLSPEALARVERRIRDNAARRRAERKLPLFAGLRPAVLAGVMGLVLVVGGLTFVMEHQAPRYQPSTVAMAPSAQTRTRGLSNFGVANGPAEGTPAPAGAIATRSFSAPPPGDNGNKMMLFKSTEALERSKLQGPGPGRSGADYYMGNGKGMGAGVPVGGLALGPRPHATAKKAKRSNDAFEKADRLEEPNDLSAAGQWAQDDAKEGRSQGYDKSVGALAQADSAPKTQPTPAPEPAEPAPPATMPAPSSQPARDARKDEIAEAEAPALDDKRERHFAAPPPPAADAPDVERQAPTGTAAPMKARADEGSRLLQAEALAREGRCPEAIDAFSAVLAEAGRTLAAQRALIGRARCRLGVGQDEAARQDFSAYVARFPDGRFAAEARSHLP